MAQAEVKLTPTEEMPTLASSPNASSTLGVPTAKREAEVYSIQRRQLLLIQPALRRLPAGGQPGLTGCLPGLPPPPHRSLADPQLRRDHRSRRTLFESPGRFQPDLLPAPAALGGQPAALRIPHAPCIPPQAAHVSPRTSPIKNLYNWWRSLDITDGMQ